MTYQSKMMYLKNLFPANPSILEDILERGNNSFDLIRLVASLSVIFGHAFALHPPNGHAEPIGNLIQIDYIGTIAVYTFLFISGIFVTASYDRTGNVFRFVLLRIGRIWPALIICLLITVFIAGPLVTSLTTSAYFSAQETWDYLLTNIKLLEVRYNLPGVFGNNWYKDAVNGSLWILPVQIRLYALILVLGIIGCLKNWKRATLAVIGVIVIYYFFQAHAMMRINPLGVKASAFFFAGILAYSFRKIIILDVRISAILFVLWLFARNTNLNSTVFYIFLAYSVMVLASSKVAKRVVLPGDYSYGIYIYGFLIQQLLAYKLPLMTAYQSLVLSLPISFIVGVISWHSIERPALNWLTSVVKK